MQFHGDGVDCFHEQGVWDWHNRSKGSQMGSACGGGVRLRNGPWEGSHTWTLWCIYWFIEWFWYLTILTFLTLSHRLAEANHGKPTAVFQPVKLSVTTGGKPSAKHHIHLDMDEAAFIDQPALRASGRLPCSCKFSKWKVIPRCSVPILPKVIPNFQPSSFLSCFQLFFLGSTTAPQPAAPTYLHRAGLATARHPETRNIWRWWPAARAGCGWRRGGPTAYRWQVETIQFYNINNYMDYKYGVAW